MNDSDTPDPRKVVELKPGPRRGTLEPVRRKYDDCRHERVTVCEGSRRVECSACKAILDPFTVLLELANHQRRYLEDLDAWDARRDSLLSERYDEEWQRHAGDVVEPPSDPETRKVWDVFNEYFKGTFCGMYRLKGRKRNGPEWCGRSTYGACVSYNYARQQLMAKVQEKA